MVASTDARLPVPEDGSGTVGFGQVVELVRLQLDAGRRDHGVEIVKLLIVRACDSRILPLNRFTELDRQSEVPT